MTLTLLESRAIRNWKDQILEVERMLKLLKKDQAKPETSEDRKATGERLRKRCVKAIKTTKQQIKDMEKKN